MAAAEVGDDVYGEDPTVIALEEQVAELFGHQAALFVPSGTMGNQICLRLLVPPADELICDADAHIVTYEGGGAAQHGGIQTRTLVSPRGLLDVAAVRAQLRRPVSAPSRPAPLPWSRPITGAAVRSTRSSS
jgi:threonine aldolase